MKRIVSAILICLCLSMCLCGCGSRSSDEIYLAYSSYDEYWQSWYWEFNYEYTQKTNLHRQDFTFTVTDENGLKIRHGYDYANGFNWYDYWDSSHQILIPNSTLTISLTYYLKDWNTITKNEYQYINIEFAVYDDEEHEHKTVLAKKRFSVAKLMEE